VTEEKQLEGGVANAGRVTRAGDMVLRPGNAHSRTVHRFLSALRATGFVGASAPVGIDPDGRERLEFIEGDVPVPLYPTWAQHDTALSSIAELMNSFHDASRTFDPDGSTWSDEMADPLGGRIVCHNDVCLENVVFRNGIAVGLLDFDFAAPGRPVYDLAQIDDDVNAVRLGWQLADRPARLRLVADAYGLAFAAREELLTAISQSIALGGRFVRRRVEAGDRNFIKMWDAMGGEERFERRARWWDAEVETFRRALA
jgi:hypothetical protein